MSRIVVGVDGSEPARRALEWAIVEAGLRGARLQIVHAYDDTPAFEVYEYPTYVAGEVYRLDREHAEQAARQLVEDLATVARSHASSLRVDAIISNDRRPARALIEHARGADLLVVGSRGRGGFAGLRLGSVSHQCAHHAPCPLTIVPEPS